MKYKKESQIVPQTKLIPANLPLYFQCLSVPVEWQRAPVRRSVREALVRAVEMKRAGRPDTDIPEVPDPDILEVLWRRGPSVLINPIEKRNQFFQLKEGDFEGLLEFLNSVGFFEPADHALPPLQVPKFAVAVPPRAMSRGKRLPFRFHYVERTSAKHIWKMSKLVQYRLERHKELELGDFQLRFLRVKGAPRLVVTTTTFWDSLLLSVHVDRIKGAKMQKCERADCGIVFFASSGHARKYCSRRCAHNESVRKSRERRPT
jgi:hypothetical protein